MTSRKKMREHPLEGWARRTLAHRDSFARLIKQVTLEAASFPDGDDGELFGRTYIALLSIYALARTTEDGTAQVLIFDPDAFDMLRDSESAHVDDVGSIFPYDSAYIEFPNGIADYDLSGFGVLRTRLLARYVTDFDRWVGLTTGGEWDPEALAEDLASASTITTMPIDTAMFEPGAVDRRSHPNYDADRASEIADRMIDYVCAVNADVREVYRPSAGMLAVRRNPKKAVRRVPTSEVGFTMGSALRAYSETRDNANTPQIGSQSLTWASSKKRPHIRRGHYHHYWVGHRDSPDRHLVLKFVAPVLVNEGMGAARLTGHVVEAPVSKGDGR